MKGTLEKNRAAELQILAETLGIHFEDISLLQQAVTHSSYANECKNSSIQHNERLEFLGDAVLDLVISEYLFCKFTDLAEGDLTKARANIVCEQTLARRATELALGKYLLLGKGETCSGGRKRVSILADAFEAVIGAIYLDSGSQNAAKFILGNFHNELLLVERGEGIRDYKTLLQECVQKNHESKITYEVVAESGPDHDKVFEVAVNVNLTQMGAGAGRTKKEAEQNAAKQALIRLNVING